MSLEQLYTRPEGPCPVCSASVVPRGEVEETEILSCPECRSLLVVEGRERGRLVFAEAPRIEEDWGE
jgi:Zn-finger nucleic acid-binding protein